MPDLSVHLLTTYIANHKLKLEPYLVLVGAMFPDILGRVFIVLWPQNYVLNWVSVLLHSPILVLLGVYLAVMLFRESERKVCFLALSIGALGHLLLDMLQRHYRPSYYWFFPFTFRTFEIPLFWSDEFVLTIPFWFLLTVLIWRRTHRQSLVRRPTNFD
ncbi:hypothetical protein KKB83_05170 [Patescibacteria group bacterium]|nr:hypothetical protein [Patescibacteria group bacterium]